MEDRAIYGKAFAAAEIKRFTKARRIAETANNPLPAKVIRWLALRKANVIPAVRRPRRLHLEQPRLAGSQRASAPRRGSH